MHRFAALTMGLMLATAGAARADEPRPVPLTRFAREAVAARASISSIDLRAQRLRNPGRHDPGILLSGGYVVTAPAQ